MKMENKRTGQVAIVSIRALVLGRMHVTNMQMSGSFDAVDCVYAFGCGLLDHAFAFGVIVRKDDVKLSEFV